MMRRIAQTFTQLAKRQKKALITFLMAGDPTAALFARMLAQLPAAGADIIEIGMPFSDPMADGAEIQQASQRALQQGIHTGQILSLIADFRTTNTTTPIVLMGYYNPIRHYGLTAFVDRAYAAGVDGLIVVDLPPEEEQALRPLCQQSGLDLIRLLSPLTSDQRLQKICRHVSGFLYCISVTGITGGKSARPEDIKHHIARIRAVSDIPVVAGFGIDSAAKAQAIYPAADGIVVGSALVKTIRLGLEQGWSEEQILSGVIAQVQDLGYARTTRS